MSRTKTRYEAMPEEVGDWWMVLDHATGDFAVYIGTKLFALNKEEAFRLASILNAQEVPAPSGPLQ